MELSVNDIGFRKLDCFTFLTMLQACAIKGMKLLTHIWGKLELKFLSIFYRYLFAKFP